MRVKCFHSQQNLATKTTSCVISGMASWDFPFVGKIWLKNADKMWNRHWGLICPCVQSSQLSLKWLIQTKMADFSVRLPETFLWAYSWSTCWAYFMLLNPNGVGCWICFVNHVGHNWVNWAENGCCKPKWQSSRVFSLMSHLLFIWFDSWQIYK